MPISPETFPAATIAAYGPDDTRATKLVVAVFDQAGAQAPIDLKNWIGSGGDLREDPGTAAEITQFLLTHGVKRAVSPDHIIGCPHQEGVDYPQGGVCPLCPYWVKRNRLAREALSAASNRIPPPVPAPALAGRNAPCPCGSGRKYKRCCGRS